MLFAPTIGAAVAARYWFLWVRCPACRTTNAIDTAHAYEQALEPKKLVLISGGHFDPYLSEFHISCDAAVDWFRRHLAP